MMRLPRVRFTVRRMMIVVAIVAILIGVGLQVRRAHRNFQEFTR
jgi:Tfp pilus assembly protein PilE